MYNKRQFQVEYESDIYNKHRYNPETDEYGCYIHDAGGASTIKSAKQIINKTRREHASENPHNFMVVDIYDIDEDGYPIIVYKEA